MVYRKHNCKREVSAKYCDYSALKRAGEEDRQQSKFSRKKKASRTFTRPLASLSIFALLTIMILALLASCGIARTSKDSDRGKITDSLTEQELSSLLDSDFVGIDGTFTSRKIDSEETALEAIQDAALLIGLENAKEELGYRQTDRAFDHVYYRFTQEYKGIPVYGRKVVVAADSAGNPVILTSNCTSLRDIRTEAKIDEETARQQLSRYFKEVEDAFGLGLIIYSLGEQEPELAWQFYVQHADDYESCFISAYSGDLLATSALIYGERVLCTGVDIDGEEQSFYAELENNTYTLRDSSRELNIYDAHKSTVEIEYIVVGSNDEVYLLKDVELVDESGHIYKYSYLVDESGHIYEYSYTGSAVEIKDDKGKTIDTNAYYGFMAKAGSVFSTVTRVKSKSSVWKNPKAVTLMSRLSAIYDFWYINYQRKSFDDNYGEIHAVYDNFDNGNKEISGYSWAGERAPVTVLLFGIENSLDLDTMAHEYMHSIERSISSMAFEAESGALCEAYSDIFGEILEDWCNDQELNNNCNWINAVPRNMIDPRSNEYPDHYLGEYWRSIGDLSKKNDYGGIHKNSTVISHAAYLMTTGLSDDPRYEVLSMKELSDLLYATLFILPSDCTFSQFRACLLKTAKDVVNLSFEKCFTVSHALHSVGISSEGMAFATANNFELSIYDVTGELCNNCSVAVFEKSITIPQEGSKSVSIKKISDHEIKTRKPLSLSLEDGSYILKIQDLNGNNEHIVELLLAPSGSDNISVFTTFPRYGSTLTPVDEGSDSDFFDLLYDEIIPEIGLIDKKENLFKHGEPYPPLQVGVISAFIEDFDGDGDKEMLVFSKNPDNEYCLDFYEKDAAGVMLASTNSANIPPFTIFPDWSLDWERSLFAKELSLYMMKHADHVYIILERAMWHDWDFNSIIVFEYVDQQLICVGDLYYHSDGVFTSMLFSTVLPEKWKHFNNSSFPHFNSGNYAFDSVKSRNGTIIRAYYWNISEDYEYDEFFKDEDKAVEGFFSQFGIARKSLDGAKGLSDYRGEFRYIPDFYADDRIIKIAEMFETHEDMYGDYFAQWTDHTGLTYQKP